MTDFQYGAFISYRRGGLDEAVARLLHRELERYRTPRRLVKKGVPKRIGPVFLDTEEREAAPDLDESLRDVLDASEWLVVVCSERTPESTWVTDEVEHFAERRRDKILPLLIAGEPEDAYPPTLLQGGEPKAADIRQDTPAKTLRQLRRSEKLALLAPMLGLRYDDLKQRERERTRRRRFVGGSVTSIVLAGVVALSLMARSERRRGDLLDTLAGIEVAIQEEDHERAVELAATALVMNEDYDLGADRQVEEAIRGGFDLPFFRRVIAEAPGEVRSLAASATDSSVAVAIRGGGARVYDPATDGAWRALDTEREEVTTLAFRPDSGVLAAGTATGLVFLFDGPGARNGIEVGFGRINQLSFSADGRRLAVASEDGVFLVDLNEDGYPLRTVGGTSFARSVAFGRGGEWLAGTASNEVLVWRLAEDGSVTRLVRLPLPPDFETMHLDAEASSFRLLATAHRSPESALFIWDDLRDPSTARAVFLNEDVSLQARFLGRNEIALFGAATALRFLGPGDRVSAPLGDLAPPTLAVVPATGEIVAADTEAGAVIAVDVTARELLPRHLPGADPVRDLVFLGEGSDRLAAAYQGASEPTIWSLDGSMPYPVPTDGAMPEWAIGTALNALAADPARPDRLIGALDRILGGDDNLLVWNPEAPGEARALAAVRGNATDLALARSGELLALIGSIEPLVELRDLAAGSSTILDVPSTAPLVRLSLSADDTAVTVAARDRTGRTWLVRPGGGDPVELPRPDEAAPSGFSVRFSPAGDQLAVSGPDQVRIQDIGGARTLDLRPPTRALDLAFAPDGGALFAAAEDGRVLRWNVGELREEAFQLGPPGPTATSVAVSADNRLIAAGYADGSIVLWPRLHVLRVRLLSAIDADPSANQR